MASTIGFKDVQAYLDGIAVANGSILSSPHKMFWRVTYEAFISGNVPGVQCQGAAVPIINTGAPEQSPFFLIMIDPAGWCGWPQMPPGGPNIDPANDNVQIDLADGTVVTGKQVRENLATWLKNGFPKDPTPIPPTP